MDYINELYKNIIFLTWEMLETEAVLKAVRNLDRGTLQPKIEIWLSSQYFLSSQILRV